jgi:transcriptional regulator with XRE-family HTH domain
MPGKKKVVSPIAKLRKQLGLNQSEFWSRVGVTQSGGSRYETGRKLARPVTILIDLVYGKNPERLLKRMRQGLR